MLTLLRLLNWLGWLTPTELPYTNLVDIGVPVDVRPAGRGRTMIITETHAVTVYGGQIIYRTQRMFLINVYGQEAVSHCYQTRAYYVCH